MVNAGLGRTRSAAHAMVGSLCVVGVAALTFVIVGFSWQGVPGGPAHVVHVAGKGWNWIAAEPLFVRGPQIESAPVACIFLLQLFGVCFAALIPLSSGADRWRLSATCASTALIAGCVYPLFAHWVWGGGWLAQLGANYGLGRGFVDCGGSSTIQAVGGFTALSVTWILGPRRDKFLPDGMPTALPGHNVVLTLLGCLFACAGWIGLNSAGAVLLAGVDPNRVALIAINTILVAAASGLTVALLTRIRFDRPDASLTANGWMAGLVASSAPAAFLRPATAIIVGIVAGLVVAFAIDLLESKFGIDDPGGAISVHAVAGVWGILAVALLSNAGMQGGSHGQWIAQLAGIATLLGFVLPLSYGLNWLLDRIHRQRVHADGERYGMDLYELGAGAYPEFTIQSENFFQR